LTPNYIPFEARKETKTRKRIGRCLLSETPLGILSLILFSAIKGSLAGRRFVNIDDFGFAGIIHGFVAGDALQLKRYPCHAVDLLADSG
jgi:hypothetical protein